MISVKWYDAERTIILEEYPKNWTWEAFYELRDIVPPMMKEVDHVVHVIAVLGDNIFLPRGNALLHARNVLNGFPDNWGLLIMVTNSVVANSLTNVFVAWFPAFGGNKIRLVKSMEEALELIREYE